MNNISLVPSAMARMLPAWQPQQSIAPAAQDEHQAQRVADTVTQSSSRGPLARRPRLAPELAPPGAAPLDVALLPVLVPQMAGQHPAMVPGASSEAFVALHRAAATAAARGVIEPGEAVVAQAYRWLGLVTADGALVYPTPAQMRALAGLETVAASMQMAGELLSDAPALQAELAKASAVPEEELPIRMTSDPRMAYVLMLVAILMQMNASQREQAVAMVNLAVQSVQAMGESMERSAKSTQTAKIVVLAVGAVVAGGGVAMGGVAAYRGISSLRANKVNQDALSVKAGAVNSESALGLNNAPSGSAATPPHVAATRNLAQTASERASTLESSHAVNNLQNGVVSSGAHALTQAGTSAGAVAGSPYDLESTGHSVDAEKDRVHKDVEFDLGNRINQDVSKTSEAERALFTVYSNRGQDNKQAADHIVGNMKR